jgi:hypothetical protein
MWFFLNYVFERLYFRVPNISVFRWRFNFRVPGSISEFNFDGSGILCVVER